MKIAITGASGFIGSEIIPYFQRAGFDLLLIGRDATRLQQLYPDIPSATYEDLPKELEGYDSLLHLAVKNNDQPGSYEEFRTANVDLFKTVLSAAGSAGLKSVINTSTLHAINTSDDTAYARSKREAEATLKEQTDVPVINIRLPAVYGTKYKGKLAKLYSVPKFLRPVAFQFLAALKPTVHVEMLFERISEVIMADSPVELIVTDGQAKNYVYRSTRKIIDLAFVFTVVFGLWWVLLIAWMAVKFTSTGPGVFAQNRVGKNGKVFHCYKFRTMHLGTENVGTHNVDARQITKVGRFLRRTKIDELPQFWNILVNDMSLVGPRPCLPVQQELISARLERGVLIENGGITGLSQINNVDMSDPVKLAKLDADYFALRTVPLDLKIMIATAIGRGQGDKTK